jgi:hypothetical protein
MAVSLLLFVNAGCDEYRGSTRAPSGRYNRSHYTITKQAKPEEFHNAMTYHWAYAIMILIASLIAYMIESGEEKSDILSPDFAGNKDLDDWSDAMKKEEEQHKNPKS